jgi:hypothetical protein
MSSARIRRTRCRSTCASAISVPRGSTSGSSPAICSPSDLTSWLRCGSCKTDKDKPCLSAFPADRRFPSFDRGPVLRRALTGLASRFRSLLMGLRRLFIWRRNLCEARILNLFGRVAQSRCDRSTMAVDLAQDQVPACFRIWQACDRCARRRCPMAHVLESNADLTSSRNLCPGRCRSRASCFLD